MFSPLLPSSYLLSSTLVHAVVFLANERDLLCLGFRKMRVDIRKHLCMSRGGDFSFGLECPQLFS